MDKLARFNASGNRVAQFRADIAEFILAHQEKFSDRSLFAGVKEGDYNNPAFDPAVETFTQEYYTVVERGILMLKKELYFSWALRTAFITDA